MNRIERIVAKANVTIAFFTYLNIVIIRDDKNVMNITNSKKTSVLLRIVKASKVSIKNISKSLNRMKNFMKRFKIIFFKVSTIREKSI